MLIYQSEVFPEVKTFVPRKFRDERGWFSETYNAREWKEELGINVEFLQDNHAYTKYPNTIRGLHFQNNPQAVVKIVRCIKGAILDVVVDIRKGSPTYKKWDSFVLSPENELSIVVPVGFAHGVLVLRPDTEVLYKMTPNYSPEHDRSIAWNDPEIGIEWNNVGTPILSSKDASAPMLKDSDANLFY